jgi:hypothetical protein
LFGLNTFILKLLETRHTINTLENTIAHHIHIARNRDKDYGDSLRYVNKKNLSHLKHQNLRYYEGYQDCLSPLKPENF